MLKAIAISAPHWVSNKNKNNSYSFNSLTPFSLQNALRDAIDCSINNKKSHWYKSNFNDFKTRNEAVLLLEYWEQDRNKFERIFDKINPNLLFIGAMSLSFRGAIEIAKYAKEKKGDDIFIVLGGKHVNETVFKSKKTKQILNHVGSPLTLMQQGSIPRIFDLVVSGDGEKVVSSIGEIIGKLIKNNASFDNFSNGSNREKLIESQGNWVAGQLVNNEIIYYENKPNNFINYSSLAYPLEQFEFKKGFKIFKTDYTIHAYSDGSRGCGYDCFFCSEKATINGKLRIKDYVSVNRLFQQFYILKKIKEKRYKKKSVSVFIEDSIMLTGKPGFIETFADKCIKNKIKIKYGAQFTLDTFLTLVDKKHEEKLKKLIEVGLDYVAFGIETVDDEIALSFSKNTNKKVGWLEKTLQVVLACQKYNLKCGMFLIWGLGETQEMRLFQLEQILQWISKFNVPIDIGLNIATQHPLQIVNDTHLNKFGYKKYNYLDWGTDANNEYLPYYIELFGEASTNYAIYKDKLPTIKDLKVLRDKYIKIKRLTYNLI